jgi:hypothetical protein
VILAALALLQADPAAALDAELLAANSATAVLQKRCAAPIRAEPDPGPPPAETPGLRARLKAEQDAPIAYRRVRLVCGTRILSRAENWYLPGRLTSDMNAALAGDTPFGTAIRPLKPSRRTLAHGPLHEGDDVLRHRALVLDGAGKPLAEVVETYTGEALR